MRLLSNTFKALSDETRLQIMTLLLENDELCVCDFVGALGQTQSKISRHLRYLYNAGLVEDRRQGLWMYYRLSRELAPEQAVVVQALAEAVGEDRRAALREALGRWFEEKDATGACGGQTAVCSSAQGDTVTERPTVERRDEMIEVKVFGAVPPCVKCKQVEEAAKKAAAKFPGQVRVQKLSALSPEAVGMGFTSTPALVVNGRVVSQGRVPLASEVEDAIQRELGG